MDDRSLEATLTVSVDGENSLTYERAGLQGGHAGPRTGTVTFTLIYCEHTMTAFLYSYCDVHSTPVQ